MINRMLNQSIQVWREKVSLAGAQHYLTQVNSTFTTGNTSPFPFQILDLRTVASGLVRTFRVDVTVNSEYYPLEQVPFQHLEGRTDATGIPVAWSHINTAQIAIAPGPGSAYPYAVWYLPQHEDLVADGDIVDGVSGWEQVWVWETVLKLINRDQYPEAFQMAAAMKAELEAAFVSSATKVTLYGGARRGRDSLGARIYRHGKRLPPP